MYFCERVRALPSTEHLQRCSVVQHIFFRFAIIPFPPVRLQLEGDSPITGLDFKIIPDLGELKDESLFTPWKWDTEEDDNRKEKYRKKLSKE